MYNLQGLAHKFCVESSPSRHSTTSHERPVSIHRYVRYLHISPSCYSRGFLMGGEACLSEIWAAVGDTPGRNPTDSSVAQRIT